MFFLPVRPDASEQNYDDQTVVRVLRELDLAGLLPPVQGQAGQEPYQVSTT